MIFLVLESHGALHFGGNIDEGAQRIPGQRVIIATSIHVLELQSFRVVFLGVHALEQEAFNLVGRIQGVAFFLIQRVGIAFQDAAHVGGIWPALLLDHFAKYHHLARPKKVCRRPIESRPVDAQAQIAFLLRGKSADRGTVKGQIVPALHQELLVIVQHVQPSFEIAEQDGHRLNALFVSQVFQPLLPDNLDRNALLALFFSFQV